MAAPRPRALHSAPLDSRAAADGCPSSSCSSSASACKARCTAFNTGDLLDILGFIGDLGAGALYFAARMMDWGIGNIHRAVADYGTKYIVVAGLLNIIAAVDAHHIAIGKKP